MYYLLDNNKIIDTNDTTFKHHYTLPNGVSLYSIETPNKIHHHYTFGGYEWNDNIYEFYSYQIKKQSNNIYDLIEVGDLVEYYFEVEKQLKKITQITKDNELYFIPKEEVISFYKKNTEGNYIKVWQKEC